MATAVVQIQTYVGTKELKIAIEKYAEAYKKPVWEMIAEIWTKMLASSDYNINIDTLYEESRDTGVDRFENQAQRRFKLTMPPELVDQVDDIIQKLKHESEKRGINRSSFTQEAIRRYLEPELIAKGYLDNTQFKDKRQAAKNLVLLRESMMLKRQEFMTKCKLLLSYPQYSAIERSGKGNIERVLDQVSEVLKIDKDVFYQETSDFLEYLTKLKIQHFKI